MQVPFVDLKVQHESIKPELDAAIAEVLMHSVFVGGHWVQDFESAFAQYIGVEHSVSCGNGTDALELALQALNIGAGDEVVVPAMTWISTAEVVSTVGAKPVFADVLPDKFTIDPAAIEEKITTHTKAIIPVHFYGRAAEMDQILAIAKKYNLKVIEDCAQAHGAEHNGQRVGSFGDMAAFSFYPSKNLGALGDAGGVVTRSAALAQACRVIANHGQDMKNRHLREGRNSRMDTLQAAILSVKLKYLEPWTDSRISIARYYNEQLADLPIETPLIEEEHRQVFHLYVIQVADRDWVGRQLADRGVATQVHYPASLPALIPYQVHHQPSDYPVAQKLGVRGLSLPMYPELTRVQQDYVIAMLREVLKG
ncbi:DegT/DnrJ/EryC1/StrS family aminotransferase [Reichenbachiella carrageenanivorans]|uniref:DegT/DnrJ/EryC1/StrS family aminotransferase n=1 Tax=Reichenbachiella carrageenanivorans TaxID=2979869 RepID=A0ABY6CYX7_9BACT|nr:DegT/DnrJ/EryC1/StrS family aminotransferase [Reichenbachiella carrageenanivorans]UXX79121.1 DegT/DnrJ/EryC1/StrS family aminotransferase [Reichenbachiella carrageenanivorans]